MVFYGPLTTRVIFPATASNGNIGTVCVEDRGAILKHDTIINCEANHQQFIYVNKYSRDVSFKGNAMVI